MLKTPVNEDTSCDYTVSPASGQPDMINGRALDQGKKKRDGESIPLSCFWTSCLWTRCLWTRCLWTKVLSAFLALSLHRFQSGFGWLCSQKLLVGLGAFADFLLVDVEVNRFLPCPTQSVQIN